MNEEPKKENHVVYFDHDGETYFLVSINRKQGTITVSRAWVDAGLFSPGQIKYWGREIRVAAGDYLNHMEVKKSKRNFEDCGKSIPEDERLEDLSYA